VGDTQELLDFPPLASLHREGLQPEQLDEWQKWFSAGANAQAAEHFAEAVSDFHKAGEIDDSFAELAFQRALCELELKQSAPADNDFRRARDLDTLRFRADSPINEIIRKTAKAKGISLLDTDETFTRFGGKELFYDHVHLNFGGNWLSWRGRADRLRTWPASLVRRGNRSDCGWCRRSGKSTT